MVVLAPRTSRRMTAFVGISAIREADNAHADCLVPYPAGHEAGRRGDARRGRAHRRLLPPYVDPPHRGETVAGRTEASAASSRVPTLSRWRCNCQAAGSRSTPTPRTGSVHRPPPHPRRERGRLNQLVASASSPTRPTQTVRRNLDCADIGFTMTVTVSDPHGWTRIATAPTVDLCPTQDASFA